MSNIFFDMKNIGAIYRLAFFSNIPKIYPSLKPKSIMATCKLTENCNSKCIGCNFHRSVSKDMSSGEWIKVFQQLADFKIRYVRFSGGEPMMRQDIYELIRVATELGFNVSMQSNILLLDRKKIKKLIDNGLKKISVSIDGIDDDYSNYRGVDSFPIVRDVAHILRDYLDEIKVTITPNITCSSLSELYKVVEFSEEIKIPISGFNLVNFTHYFFDDESCYNRNTYNNIDRENLKEFSHFLKKNRSKYLRIKPVDLYAIKRYFEDFHIPELPCLNPVIGMCIGSDGSIYGCCSMPAVGNVLRQPLQEILNSRNMATVISAALKKSCPGCSCGLYISSAMNIKYQYKSRMKQRDC